jgi:hypothetical protein
MIRWRSNRSAAMPASGASANAGNEQREEQHPEPDRLVVGELDHQPLEPHVRDPEAGLIDYECGEQETVRAVRQRAERAPAATSRGKPGATGATPIATGRRD